MTAIDPNAQQGPQTLSDGTVQVDPALVTNSLLNALQQVTSAAASSGHSGAEAKDFAAAALSLAQAIVVMDPSLSQGGTPLAHDVAIKQIDSQTQTTTAAIQAEAMVQAEHIRGQNAVRAAKETAAAPTPSKKITINREDGRMTGVTQEG